LVKHTIYGAPHYAFFSSFPPLLPPKAQIFSSATFYPTHLIYIHLLVWQTKSHIQTKQQVKLCCSYFNINICRDETGRQETNERGGIKQSPNLMLS